MKKLVSFALSLALMACAIPAFADGPDLQSMSDDELVSLRDAINAELASRNFQEKEVTVPPGRYKVGEDIPAGTYTISAAGKVMSMVTTYTASGDYGMIYNVTSDSPVGKLELADGQEIEISVEPVTFSVYKGIGF